jgi:hypothetical protein
LHLRLDEAGVEPHQRPALAELPALLMDAGQAPLLEPVHRPLARLLDRRRPRQPWAVDVGEPEDVVHHLGVGEAFVADLPDGREIELLDPLNVGTRRGLARFEQSGEGRGQYQDR